MSNVFRGWAAGGRPPREAALPFVRDLHQATHETVHPAVLEGTEVVYVEILPGTRSPRLPSRVGGRMPAHCTGVGRAILAFSPPATVEAVVARGLEPRSPRTIVMPSALHRQLAVIARTGTAFDREEPSLGIACVAGPILGPGGDPIGAMSLTGWSRRIDVDRMASAVRTATLSLSRHLRTADPGT